MTSCILGVFDAAGRASGSSMGAIFLLMRSHLPHIRVDMQQVCSVFTVRTRHKGCTT